MSHSRHGECDIDPQKRDETSGSEQPNGGAHDPGTGSDADGCQATPHQAHPGSLSGEGRCRRCPRLSGPQGPQRDARARCNCCGSSGSHQVRKGQPHASQRTAERARGNRYRQVYPAAYPGHRRTEQSSTKASAQAPGAPPARAPGGHADPDGRQPPPVAGESGTAVHAVDRGGRCHWYCGRGPLLPAGRRPQLLPADAIPDRALRHTRCPVHRPARGIQAHTRLRPPWDAHPVQPGYGGAGGSR